MGKEREEQSHANESVAAVVAGRVDDTAVSLTADNGSAVFHLSDNVDFAHCRCCVFASVAFCHVAERA